MEKEKDFELESLLKDLANYKVQLEVSESAYKQALLDLNHYRQKADELSTKLKNSESQDDKCIECKGLILELESKISDTKLEAFMREELDKEKKRAEELMTHAEERHETIWLLQKSAEGEATINDEQPRVELHALTATNSWIRPCEHLQLAMVARDAKKDVSSGTVSSNESRVTISKEEYEVLVTKAKEMEQIRVCMVDKSHNNQAMEDLKKELDAATARIGQLRSRAEHAMSRAEVAELAKEELEEQIRRWRGRKEKRKTALAALREESYSEESSSYAPEQAPKHYVQLAKVLNMKF